MKSFFRIITSSFIMAILIAVISNGYAENAKPAKKIPKWKLEHQARVINAAKVCESPTIHKKVDSNNLTTGFYTITLISEQEKPSIAISDDAQVVLSNTESTPRQWLLSKVGAGLYHIASCYQDKPICLSLVQDKKIAVTQCDSIAYGDQVWWLKGFLNGPNAGGWYLGNDGLGQMECLIASDANSMTLKNCNQEQKGWRFNRVVKSQFNSTAKPKVTSFPKEAYVIDYQCESGELVNTFYDDKTDQMHVRYKNEMLVLDAAQSGSGAKFGDASQPWGWWTKAESGSIYQTNGDETFIENCIEVKENQLVQQQKRVWNAQAFEDGAAVSDCTDCEEDLGLVMRCKTHTLTAEVNVWLNADEAVRTKQLFLEVDVDNKIYQYPFEAEYYEMIGHHIVKFEIHKNDSIFDALKQANKATFRVTNDELKVGLVASKQAINDFRAYCGWA